MKIWITKYALITGIHSAEAEPGANGAMFIRAGTLDEAGRPMIVDEHIGKSDWFATEAEAVVHAEAMREKKILWIKINHAKATKRKHERIKALLKLKFASQVPT